MNKQGLTSLFLSITDICGEGKVNATDNNLRRSATTNVSVTVNGRTAAGTDSEAVLEQEKSRCIEVACSGVKASTPASGFLAKG